MKLPTGDQLEKTLETCKVVWSHHKSKLFRSINHSYYFISVGQEQRKSEVVVMG